MFCQARVLATLHTIPNTKLTYHTTAECGESASKKIPVDSGEAFMPICGGCFKRFMTKMSVNNNWYGWFDGSYPPNAKVRGSAWYNEHMAFAHETVTNTIDMDEVAAKLNSLSISEASSTDQLLFEAEAEVDEAEAEVDNEQEEAQPEAEVEAQADDDEPMNGEAEPEEPAPTKEEQKQALKAQIKELQKNAKPGKMSLKEIQATFKEITNLKTKIHML